MALATAPWWISVCSAATDCRRRFARTRPNVPQGDRERQTFLLEGVKQRSADVANQYRDRLVALYGKERGQAVKYAEAFQLGQYGRQASADELKKMFPVSR